MRFLLRFLFNPRINLSPFTKDFRGEEHYNESIVEVGKLVTFRNPLLPVTRLVGTRYSVFVTLIVTG